MCGHTDPQSTEKLVSQSYHML